MRVTYLKSLPKQPRVNYSTLRSLVCGGCLLPDGRNMALVESYNDYMRASATKKIDTILLVEHVTDRLHRIKLLRDLAKDDRLNLTKSNWLYGLSNPAELTIYPEVLTDYYFSFIQQVLCESAFHCAIYGIRFSRQLGIFEPVPVTCSLENYELSKEQLRVFQYNVGIVADFIHGDKPEDYLEITRAIMEDI